MTPHNRSLANFGEHELEFDQPRPGRIEDLDRLLLLEQSVFRHDRISRGSFRRFLTSQSAHVLICEVEGQLAGSAVVLFRRGSRVARLYSLGVAAEQRGRRIGEGLLAAAESAALARGATSLRLEVRPDNEDAIALYRRRGYRQIGQYADFYTDHSDALRFEKPLVSSPAGGDVAP